MKRSPAPAPVHVGQDINAERAAWSFGGTTPDRFVEHAERSIPMYREGHELVCQLSDHFCHEDSICYELGTSTGELLSRLAAHNAHRPRVRWVGIDREARMAEKARAHCADFANVEVACEDILAYAYEASDFIVSYYTIQFVPPRVRQEVFDKVYTSLNWGGAFVLFEKVRGPDARFQDLLAQLYVDFKQRKGFSADEILGKSASLRGVLEPFSTQGNVDLLRRAGFVDIVTIFKYVCFEGFVAIK